MSEHPGAHGREGIPAKVSVLGLGRTGIATARFLADLGVDVVASDNNEKIDPTVQMDLDARGVRVELGRNIVREGDTVVISPGIPPHSALFQHAQKMGGELISEPELFSRIFPKPIVAITGTDGKSTVTTWIAHILNLSGIKAIAGGNLGNPLLGEEGLDLLDVAVLEISAFQLVTTQTLQPAVAVVTNLAEDHLDYFEGSAESYEAAKRKLVDLCGQGSKVVVPAYDPVVLGWDIPLGAQRLLSSRSPGEGNAAWLEGGAIWLGVDEAGKPLSEPVAVGSISDLPLVGAHNEKNALQVVLATRLMGVSLDSIRAGLTNYEPLPHRCTVVGTVDGIRFIDDSKATNPHAAMAALEGLDCSVVLIAGGSEKDSSFEAFGLAIGHHTRAVVATGETAERILGSVPAGHPAVHAKTFEEAVRSAFKLAKPGDTVLLSPGCASFDSFRSYGHRGEVFSALVLKMRSELGP